LNRELFLSSSRQNTSIEHTCVDLLWRWRSSR